MVAEVGTIEAALTIEVAEADSVVAVEGATAVAEIATVVAGEIRLVEVLRRRGVMRLDHIRVR